MLKVFLPTLLLLSTSLITHHSSLVTQPQLKPCTLPGVDEQPLCGKLSVFENRTTRTGRKIDLNVVVLPALEQQNKQAPLFDLAGGPGVGATISAPFYATQGREVRRNRDVVLVDQRGTGASNPLQCDRSGKKPLDEMYPVNYVVECRKQLERVADLTQYTTPIAMEDLDDVRARLGYDQINLFGASYGTRAALVYLRQHPDRVRSMILMGVAPTYSKLPMYHTRNAMRAMELLFAQCTADTDCNNAYPRLRQTFEDVLAKLEKNAARVKYNVASLEPNGAVTNKLTEVEIRHDLFAEEIRTQLYTTGRARRVPFIINEAAKGNFEPFLKAALPDNPYAKSTNLIADGMYLSVTCAEDVPFIDTRESTRINKGTLFGNYRVEQQTRACQNWPRGSLPKDYDKGVKGTAPVLIISGNMDPVTSPDWANEVAALLPNSKLWTIPYQAHGPAGLSNVSCLDGVMRQFVDNPNPTQLDTSCTPQMLPPPFYVDR